MDIIRTNKIIEGIYESIKDKNLKVVLPEGEDDRVIEACSMSPGITKVLLGNKSKIEKKFIEKYGAVIKDVEIIDEELFSKNEKLFELLLEKRKGKITNEEAQKLFLQSNYYATLMLENQDVHALVGGCCYSTADILKPAFQIIKPAPGNSIVSSCFIMQRNDETLIFGDCAVNIEPNAEQLKQITLQTIKTSKQMGVDPKVAMLSYSTKGSGFGERVDTTRTAYEMLINEDPSLKDYVDGELQFDAAYASKVGKIKCPDSKVAGNANVFIFPHIASGNIGYKMVQYLGGYEAIGPLLQGLNKPVNDLSRGTDAPTIAKLMYFSLRDYK